MTEIPYVLKAEGIEIHDLMSAPAIQIDGISQVLVGSPLVKLVFHQVIAPPNPATSEPEIRKACLVITIPVGDAVTLAQTILTTVKSNQGEIEKMRLDQENRLKLLLDGLTVTTVPASK